MFAERNRGEDLILYNRTSPDRNSLHGQIFLSKNTLFSSKRGKKSQGYSRIFLCFLPHFENILFAESSRADDSYGDINEVLLCLNEICLYNIHMY